MKKISGIVIVFSLIVLISCNKSDTKLTAEVPENLPIPTPVEQTESPTPPPLRGGAHNDIPDLSGAMVVVPDMVKGKWQSVTLMLEDKKSHAITEHIVSLGEEWTVPNSEIKVKVGTFFPDLIIQGKVFTSVSNELKNPAIHVTINEKGSELFKGWLFSLFPMMHPFQHDRFAITLKDVTPS